MNYTPNLGIKTWAEEDRPREKLHNKGATYLTDAELLAILLGSGSREESAVSLARRILLAVDNDLQELGKKTIADLCQFKGIGLAKAITIIAAMELSRRRQLSDIKIKTQVKSSQEVFQLLAPIMMDLHHEEFWIVMLNRANRILGKVQISSGGVSGTVVDAKIVFRKALEERATSIILTHNHPSGNLKPSQADIDLTQKLKKAGQNIDIQVLDHIIISAKGYFSFADEGLL